MSKPSNARRILIVILLVLFGTLAIYELIAVGWRFTQNSQSDKVAAAIRTTFPLLCRGRSLVVSQETGTDRWSALCDPNPVYMAKDTPLVFVNITTCKVEGGLSLTLMSDYPELFSTPLLKDCPLQ